jgi:hypothetical protein
LLSSGADGGDISDIPRLSLGTEPNTPGLQKRKDKMKLASKKVSASVATLFTFVFFVMTASTAHAEDYCITNGSQAAHGCGYPTLETCQAASSGIGGICAAAPSSRNPGDALAYQPKQSHSRRELHLGKEPTRH